MWKKEKKGKKNKKGTNKRQIERRDENIERKLQIKEGKKGRKS